ncbi:MAG TPA: carboxypeptidase-like regulatory domain-containing protein, partial [Ignavibacteriaceae bacterium]|nr:carboxypeptidase-like regulatory domain-containing protein [Ignavibacteriaceae bacterium]
MRRIIFIPGILLSLILFLFGNSSASASSIEGIIKDTLTNEPLIGANVILTGTSLGAATDESGKYIIRNIPAGFYTMRVTYIGYETMEEQVQVKENEILDKDFNLKPVGIEGETVLITAQASGQVEAINKQLSSNQILNAVSSARIQELPDANAAESVGRLPGISLLRSGGEGDKVVIRGLAPQYNVITVNGVKLSSSDQNDRSADLSMISPNMLEGIQVSKTVTADMDANAIGGIVNFDLREAKAGLGEIPLFSFLGQGAYNGLPNAKDKYKNYKFVGTVENRFFDSRLGVFLQGSIERRNLSSNELGANYGPSGNSQTDYLTQNITLYDIARDRSRNNGVLTLDYELPSGKILLSNLFSSSITESEDRRQFYNLTTAQNNANFQNNYSKSTLNTLSNTIKYTQQAWIFNTTTIFSHSYSETKNPRDWSVNFLTRGVWTPSLGNVKNLDPRDVVKAANLDPDQTLLNTISTNHSFTRERSLSLSLDFDTPLNFSKNISAIIKFGGKYQYQKRFNNIDVTNGEPFGLQSGQAMINLFKGAFPWFTDLGDGLRVSMYPFVDQNYDYGEFLNGEYKLDFPFDYSRMQSMMDYAYE